MTRTRNLREGATPAVKDRPAIADKLSDKQREFILSLLDERDVPEDGDRDTIVKCLRISEDPEELGMTKREASRIIDLLLKAPKKPREPWPGYNAEVHESATREEHANSRERGDLPDIPAGHYAVTGEDGTTDFYRVDRPEHGKWAGYTFVKLQLSDFYERMPFKNQVAILHKIEDAGPREAAIRYGKELGRCSICNRTLTNPESIEAGIGPVCAGRLGWWSA